MLEWIIEHKLELIAMGALVLELGRYIVAWTPTDKDNKFVNFLERIFGLPTSMNNKK